MTIEEKVFSRKRFVQERMESFGFRRSPNGYEYVSDFMEGEFRAVLIVTDQGSIKGKVIDKMNDDEYLPLRIESYDGAYVHSVRTAYRKFLENVADLCCDELPFSSDQANRITDVILSRYSVAPDYPWGQSQYEYYGTFRHPENNKWFGLIMNVKWDTLLKNGNKESVDIINLKIDPAQEKSFYKKAGVFPGYHMNHQKWISVTLNDQLTDDEVTAMIDASFHITK